MRVKKIVSAFLYTVLCAVIPSMAAEYPIHIENQSTADPGDLYMSIGTGVGVGAGPGNNANCIAVPSGSFDTRQDITNNQRINFYTNERCSGRTLATVTLRVNPDVTKINITITNSRATVSYENTPKKTIRFFAPWTNTSAIVYVAGGDSAKMTTVKNYCGWFEASVKTPSGSFQVYFKQTIGSTYVGDNVYDKINPTTQAIWLSLDDAAAQADTIWVKANLRM